MESKRITVILQVSTGSVLSAANPIIPGNITQTLAFISNNKSIENNDSKALQCRQDFNSGNKSITIYKIFLKRLEM